MERKKPVLEAGTCIKALEDDNVESKDTLTNSREIYQETGPVQMVTSPGIRQQGYEIRRLHETTHAPTKAVKSLKSNAELALGCKRNSPKGPSRNWLPRGCLGGQKFAPEGGKYVEASEDTGPCSGILFRIGM